MQVCCLSDFDVVVHCLCEFSWVPDLLILSSHSLCLHPLTSLSTLHLCQLCLCRPCLLVLFVLTLLACVTSTSLCLSSLSLLTLLVRTRVYVNSLRLWPLCLSAPSVTLCPLYVFVPTLMSLCPRCVFAHPLVSTHSGVNSACVVCAHPLRCLRPLCFCPHCGLLVFLSIHHISAYCTSCIWQNIHLDPWIFIFEKKWNLTNQQRNKIFKPHSAPWR